MSIFDRLFGTSKRPGSLLCKAALLIKAREAERNSNHEEALDIYNEIINRFPDSSQARQARTEAREITTKPTDQAEATKKPGKRRCAACGNEQLVGAYAAYLKSRNTLWISGEEGCLKCGVKGRLAPLDFTLPEPTTEDLRMVQVLVALCTAYAASNKNAISVLEPEATRIGSDLDSIGGIREMRRIFSLIPEMRGKRTLEMHWGGIGDWMS